MNTSNPPQQEQILNDWDERYSKAHEKFKEFVQENYNQEECPEFREMIDLVLEKRKPYMIDFHGLTKYQVDVCLDDLFDQLSREMEGKKRYLAYHLIVGKGLHSDPTKGPQLPKKTLDMCATHYGVIVKDEKQAAAKERGVVEIELTPPFIVRMKIIREIKEALKQLVTLTGTYEEQSRFIIGFGKTGFKPIIADFCQERLTEAKRVELMKLVWGNIVKLMSSKFLEAEKKSLLLEKNPSLLASLSDLYHKKPQNLKNYLEIAKASPNNLHVIYTFTSSDIPLCLKELVPLDETSEHLSPKSENVTKLLSEDKQYLFWRFDERTHTKDEPFVKMTQLVKEEVDKNKLTTMKKLFFIIHLIQDSKRETDVIGYDKNWSQCMIDRLIEEQPLSA